MTTHRTRTWTFPMWIFVAQTLALTGWQVACDSGDDDGGDDDDDDDDDGDDGGTPMSGSAGEGGERVCGIIDPTISDCDMCFADNCCAASEACGNDAECNACFYTPPAPTDVESPCYFNAAYMGLIDCVSGPCAVACAKGDGSGGGGDGSGGGSCTEMSCSETPGGHAACRSAGCGDCSFGKCLLF